METNYIPARTGPPSLPAVPDVAPVVPDVPALWTPQQISEKTTGMDRAAATVHRSYPMTAILAILAAGLMLSFDLSLGITVLIFSALTIAGYWLLNRLDYQHSASGLERHRINQYAKVKQVELDYSYRLKALTMRAYLDLLRRHYDHN